MKNLETMILKNVSLAEGGIEAPCSAMVIQGNIIQYAGPLDQLPAATTGIVVDGSDWILAPGLIDLQVNGAYGRDFTREPESISEIARRLPETGVTAFLPTFISSSLEEYHHKLEATLQARHVRSGARVFGAHIEGPFLNPDKRGAHDASLFRKPDRAALAMLEPLDAVRLLTLAPEQPGALEAVRWLVGRAIVVSLGHSAAGEAQALAALEAGATYGTHLFNALPQIHHRQPGLAGVLLTNEAARCGLIADGIHVHPRLLQLAFRCRGPQGITLVTDCMGAMGMPAGVFHIGGQRVLVDKQGARLVDGTLAGSVLRLDEAVRNAVQWMGANPAQAIQMASTTPAETLGHNDRLGHLLPGYLADLVALDRSLQVQATWIDGELAYTAPEAAEKLNR